MAHKYQELRELLYAQPGFAAEVAVQRRAMNVARALADLRKDREIPQVEDDLEVSESDNPEEIYLSALAAYIHAYGGRLEIRAVFPDQTYAIGTDGVAKPLGDVVNAIAPA